MTNVSRSASRSERVVAYGRGAGTDPVHRGASRQPSGGGGRILVLSGSVSSWGSDWPVSPFPSVPRGFARQPDLVKKASESFFVRLVGWSSFEAEIGPLHRGFARQPNLVKQASERFLLG